MAPIEASATNAHSNGSVLIVSHTPSAAPAAPSSHASTPSSPSVQSTSSSSWDLPTTATEDWENWVRNYSAGQWQTDAPLPIPPAISAILEGSETASPASAIPPHVERTLSNDSSMHLYPSSQNSSLSPGSTGPDSAGALLAYYRQHGYFPAPKGIYEEERLALMKQYGLRDVERKEAIERVLRVAKTHFQTPVVIVSLIFGDEQVMTAETGWDPVDPGFDVPARRLALPSGVCTHAQTILDPNETFIIPDLSQDWRFQNSPFALKNGGGMAFYASANIRLPTGAAPESGVPEALPVGTICLVSDKPRPAEDFGQAERKVLHDLADLVAREFQLGREQTRRESSTRQSTYLGQFLNSALVFPPAIPAPRSTSPFAPSTPTSAAAATASGPFASTAKALCELTKAGSAAILDLRLFDSSVRGVDGAGDKRAKEIFLLGESGDVAWEEITIDRSGVLGPAMREALALYVATGTTAFDSSSFDTPLAGILPHTTTASSFVPIFDTDGTLALLMALSTTEPRFKFDEDDQTFVQNVGAVVLASLIRQRVVEADRAKLAFVSQISHDFRLPLHGISSQIELLREFSTHSQLMQISPLLDAADVCLDSLRDVLNDTLDFAKLAHGRTQDPLSVQRAQATADLEQLVENVARSTWVRKKRVDLASEEGQQLSAEQVEVAIEVKQRMNGWNATLDIAGIKRVLLNILGNSLKFTKKGHVIVRLAEVPSTGPLEEGKSLVAIDIEDTGRGMSEEFLRKSLFTPFVQEDSFATGAGLGMSICEGLVKRMGGHLSVTSVEGEGTTMRVVIPVCFSPPSPPDSTNTVSSPQATPTAARSGHLMMPTVKRRVISSELGSLLSPGPSSALAVASPQVERNNFDFAQAVQATQPSFGAEALGRAASLKKKRKAGEKLKLLGVAAGEEETAIEAAKLSVTAHARSSTAAPTSEGEAPPVSIAKDVRCLTAEDNAISRTILARILNGKGVSFQSTEDGQYALDAFKEGGGSFNLALLDIQMPRMDGIQAAIEMRKVEREKGWKRCRIIALTGLSTESDLVRDLSMSDDAPIDSWMVKGGKSLRTIIDEIVALQAELDNPPSPVAPPDFSKLSLDSNPPHPS